MAGADGRLIAMLKSLVALTLVACATTPAAALSAPQPIGKAPRSIECGAFPKLVSVGLQRDAGVGALHGNLGFNYDSVEYTTCVEGANSIVCEGNWFAGGSARNTSARLEISLVPDHGAFKASVERPGGAIELGCLLSYDDLHHS